MVDRQDRFWQLTVPPLGLSAGSLLVLAGSIAMFSFFAAAGYGQQGPKCPTCPIVVPGRPLDNRDLNEMRMKNARKRDFEAANQARIRLISDETTRLVILAKDFKARTEALDRSPFSPTLVREAEAIESLANDVKEKMKLTFNPE